MTTGYGLTTSIFVVLKSVPVVFFYVYPSQIQIVAIYDGKIIFTNA